MKPIHKLNNGRGATLCHTCSVIISTGLTKDLYCDKCKQIEHIIDMMRSDEELGLYNDIVDEKENIVGFVKKKIKKNMKYTRTTTNDIIVNGHEILVKDSIVESVIEQFKQRSETGIKKYNTTLDRKDLSRLEWLQHLQEELFDASLYIEKLKTYERT